MQMSGRINTLVWLCKMISSFPKLIWLESCKAQASYKQEEKTKGGMVHGGTRINVTCLTVLSRAWAVVPHCSKIISCCSVTLTRKLAPEGQGWEPSARIGVLQVDGFLGTDSRGRRRWRAVSGGVHIGRRGRGRGRTTDSESWQKQEKNVVS